MLWQNDSGEVAIWKTNGAAVVGGRSLGNPGDRRATGTGNFDDDGESDVLFQHISGEVAIWNMDDTNIIGGGSLGNAGTDWHAVGSGHFEPPIPNPTFRSFCFRTTAARSPSGRPTRPP